MQSALGMIETFGLLIAFEAGDAALKASSVTLMSLERSGGGLVTITFRGDVGAIKVAVDAGKVAAMKIGKVLSTSIISKPHDDIARIIVNSNIDGTLDNSTNQVDKNGIQENRQRYEISELEKMSVEALRRNARTLDGLEITGREISKARREVLMKEIHKWIGGEISGS